MQMKKVKLPEMIDYYRKENRWTMKELGLRMGKSESAISRWIKGERSPMVEDVDKLAELFNASVEELMFGKVPIDMNSSFINEISSIANDLTPENRNVLLNYARNLLEKQSAEKARKEKEEKLNALMDEVINKYGAETLRDLQKIVEADDISELPDSNSK